MRLCDNCECRTDRLIPLLAEFDDMEVCEPCRASLAPRMLEIEKRVAGVRTRARRRVFEAWKTEQPVPLKTRKAFDTIRSLLHVILLNK